MSNKILIKKKKKKKLPTQIKKKKNCEYNIFLSSILISKGTHTPIQNFKSLTPLRYKA